MFGRSIAIVLFAGLCLLHASAGAQTPTAATQPDTAAAAPATGPDEAQPSRVSFYLTRSLPEHLQQRHLLAIRTQPRATQLRSIRSILDATRVSVEQTIRNKQAFDSMPTEVQDRYRQRALEIEEVLGELTATELSELRNMTPEARARRMQKLIGELRARKLREGARQGPSTPQR